MINTIGLSAGNTLAHQDTAESINTAYNTRSANVQFYAKSMSSGGQNVGNFFTLEKDKNPLTKKKDKK